MVKGTCTEKESCHLSILESKVLKSFLLKVNAQDQCKQPLKICTFL